MKVLLTTDAYFPMINGVAVSTYNLYKELKRKGVDVRVLTLSHNGKQGKIGDIYYLKSIKAEIYPGARIKMPFYNSLIKEIIEWKPDIVHSQTEFSTMLAARSIAGKLEIPLVHTYHTMYEDYTDYILKGKLISRGAVAFITRLMMKSVNEVISPTKKTQKVLKSYGVRNTNYIIPTGINMENFRKPLTKCEREELLKKHGIKPQDKLLVYVGRIAREKNILEIIDNLPEILKRVPETRCLIAGDGPFLNELKKRTEKIGLCDRVIFAGRINPKEVYKYYKLGEVFVSASTSETQGLTYLEALSCGCPILCRNDRCLDGLLHQGQNGYAYENESEFVKYAEILLKDKELRKSMSSAALRGTEDYSSKVFAERILNAYNSIIEGYDLKAAV